VLPTITIDIGTTSVKLCLFDGDGVLTVSAKHATPTIADGAGEIYDVDALRRICAGFVAELPSQARTAVQRIAITGVGESGGLVRPDLSLASPLILWHDQRGAAHLARLTTAQRTRIYRVTGLPVNGNYGLSKIKWALERYLATDGAVWLNVAEYLAAIMTGERWSEPSLASRTMALDISKGEWSAEIAGMIGVGIEVFPALRPASNGVSVSRTFAADTGLSPEVRVHVTGHDHMVGAVGAGLAAGELLNSTGTTEGLLFLRDSPDLGTRAERSKLANGIDCHGVGFTVFASIPTGGSAFATLQRMLGLDSKRLSAVIDELGRQYRAGSVRLDDVPLILPQFRGSPPPTKLAAARGLVAGIGNDTTMEEIVLGTFLGMVRQFRDVLDLFKLPVDGVKVIGPASGNGLWLQLKADLLGSPLSASRFPEVVSRGAQALASDVSCDWRDNRPMDVEADPGRHGNLLGWMENTREQWAYLKGFPL
jgi:sugar (pentulose or hexulose) kinase